MVVKPWFLRMVKKLLLWSDLKLSIPTVGPRNNGKELRESFQIRAVLCGVAMLVTLVRPAVAEDVRRGMVVSAHRAASEAGLTVLKSGGNAIDAAVAVGYALAVVDPCCGNIGGGGFMLIRQADGTASFINFRETAPAAA